MGNQYYKRIIYTLSMIIVALSTILYFEIESNKTSTIQANPNNYKTLPVINYRTAEDKVIKTIMASDTYSKDALGDKPYSYLKFTNKGFQTDGQWLIGKIGYSSAYTETDNDQYIPGKPISLATKEFSYILEFNQHGEVENLAIQYISDNNDWNKLLEQLPMTLMSSGLKNLNTIN